MKEKVTGSDSTLDIFKVTQHDRSFLRVYYCKERDREKERLGGRKGEREFQGARALCRCPNT